VSFLRQIIVVSAPFLCPGQRRPAPYQASRLLEQCQANGRSPPSQRQVGSLAVVCWRRSGALCLCAGVGVLRHDGQGPKPAKGEPVAVLNPEGSRQQQPQEKDVTRSDEKKTEAAETKPEPRKQMTDHA